MPQATCSIDGCESSSRVRGWCDKHYRRWRRRGDASARPRRLAPCGTTAAYQRHLTAKEEPCEACKQSNKERHRRYQEGRRRKMGVSVKKKAACGTVSGYYRHLKSDEQACGPCLSAKASSVQRRRATQLGNGHQPYNRTDVFAWDNWTCQMCSRKVGGKLKATIDHIIPISLGGPDTRTNVQTACLPCNCAKRDRAANDQLRLFGVTG